MFYLGSIAGILPYILAFSLTLVWGGHAGLPFFTSGSAPVPVNEMVKEDNPPVERLSSLKFENQIITKKTVEFSAPLCTHTELPIICTFRQFDSADIGISLLRAPPIFSF